MNEPLNNKPPGDAHSAPQFLVEMFEPRAGAYNRTAQIRGLNGAETYLDAHLRDSVRDLVTVPLTMVSGYTDADPLPDIFRHNDMLIVSDRMRVAIEPWLKDFEFISAAVHLSASRADEDWGKGPVQGGYSWLNSWRRIDAVDWEKSNMIAALPAEEGAPNSGSSVRAIAWERLTLRTDELDGEHFYGLAHVAGERRFISDELRRHLLAFEVRVFFQAADDRRVAVGQSLRNRKAIEPPIRWAGLMTDFQTVENEKSGTHRSAAPNG